MKYIKLYEDVEWEWEWEDEESKYLPNSNDVKKVRNYLEINYPIKNTIILNTPIKYIIIDEKLFYINGPFLNKKYLKNKLYFTIKDDLKNIDKPSILRGIKDYIK